MARVNRWPVAECLHEHTTTTELRQGLSTLLRRTERCDDCGAKRTGSEWR